MEKDNSILNVKAFGNTMILENLSDEYDLHIYEISDERKTSLEPFKKMAYKSLSPPIDISDYSFKFMKRKK
jgi:hypothetical protein